MKNSVSVSVSLFSAFALLLVLFTGSVLADTDGHGPDAVVPAGGRIPLDIPPAEDEVAPVESDEVEQRDHDQAEELQQTVDPVLHEDRDEDGGQEHVDTDPLDDTDPIVADVLDDGLLSLPAEADAEARLDWIEQALEDRLSAARLWRYGWGGIFLGATVGQVAMGTWGDPADREGNYVGAGTALIGTIGQVITSVDSGATLADVRECRRTEDPLPCAERALLETAASERTGFHWMRFVEAGLVSGGGAAVMYWGYDDGGNALLKLGMGVVVSTLKVLTLPRGGRSAWDAYQREYDLLGAKPDQDIEWDVGFTPEFVFLQARF